MRAASTYHQNHMDIIIIIIIIIIFRQCQGNYRSSVAYQDNYPFINMISFIIYKNNKYIIIL